MTRLEPLTTDTALGAARELLGALEARHGQVGLTVRTMAHSPAVLGGYLDLSRATKRAKLDRRISERISIAVQTQLGCSMCLQAHVEAARGLGLDEIEIDHARHGTSGDQAIAAIVGYGLGVYRNPAAVTDDQVEVLRHYGYRDREIADVVGVVALNVLTGTFNLTAGLSDPLGRAPVSTGRVGAGRVGAAAPPTVHPTEASKATDGHRHPTPSNDAPEHSRPTAWRAERTGTR